MIPELAAATRVIHARPWKVRGLRSEIRFEIDGDDRPPLRVDGTAGDPGGEGGSVELGLARGRAESSALAVLPMNRVGLV